MERLVYQRLIDWKNDPARKPIILNGARQVGKTWLLNEFGRCEYAQLAYVNCRNNDLARQLFAQDFDVERIIRGLRALTRVNITPGDTLLVLDEVQDIPQAIEALKYFCEDASDYHVAVAGSLLGISLHADVSFPVGKVNVIDVYPMNFEEFMMARGETVLRQMVADCDYSDLAPLHERLIELLKEYYFVGGMPEAVNKYVTTQDPNAVRKIQSEILRGYEQDFSKHTPRELVPRVRMVWQSVPSQLFKENKKFIYGALKKGARAREFELAIHWLVDSGLVYRVYRCNQPAMPLRVYEDVSAFKLYLLDVGLLGAMAGVEPVNILVTTDALTQYKGGMTEQFVLQQLKSKHINPICYHSTDDSRLEIDFVIQHQGQVLPIEVKAGVNVRANSLSRFLQQHPQVRAVRFSLLPYKQQAQLDCLPLYMA